MAMVVGLGTVLKRTISSVLTAVAQVKSISFTGCSNVTFEANTLDAGVGIPHKATGQTEGGSVSYGLFFDPNLSGHQAEISGLTTPASNVYNIVFTDTGNMVMAFTSAGCGVDIEADPTTGLGATITHKLDGIPTFTP